MKNEFDIFDLLSRVGQDASDITLSSTGCVAVRKNTVWSVTNVEALAVEWQKVIPPLYPHWNISRMKGYTNVWTAPDGTRYRAAIVPDREGETVSLRPLPNRPRSIEELRLPDGLRDYVVGLKGGLFLVGGVTGSGKTTTLMALMREIAEVRGGKFITIEDPIEYLHQNTAKALFNQREIGTSAETYATALKEALHQNPDVILVQEIREAAAAEVALSAALSGHLVMASIHAYTAPSTPQRYLSILSSVDDVGARDALASCLEGVVIQRLVQGIDGPVPIFEVMLFRDRGVRLNTMERHVRQGNWTSLRQEIETGSRFGMMLADTSLQQRIEENLVLSDQ